MHTDERAVIAAYGAALARYLAEPDAPRLELARDSGRAALAAGLGAADLPRIHDACLLAIDADSGGVNRTVREGAGASKFLRAALGAFDARRRDITAANVRLREVARDQEQEISGLRSAASDARYLIWHGVVEERDGTLVWDIAQRDETASQRFMPLDVAAGETYNEAWRRAVHPMDAERMDGVGEKALRDGSPTYEQDYRCTDRRGELRWLHEDVTVKAVSDGRWELAGICTDVTERRRALDAMHRRIARQALVSVFGQEALSGKDLDALMRHACELLVGSLEVDSAKVLELLPGGDALLLRAGVGWRDGLVGTATVLTDRCSQAGYTLLEDGPVIVEDTASETRFARPPLLEEHGLASGISVPVRVGRDVFGVVGIHARRPRAYDEEDVHFVQSIVNTLVAAIANDRAESAAVATAEMLESYGRRQATLARFGQAALATQDIASMEATACRVLRETLGADFSEALELLPDGETLRLDAGEGWDAGLVGAACYTVDEDSLARFALLTPEPAVIPEFAAQDRFRSPLLEDHSVGSGMRVAVRVAGRPFGLLGVHSVAPNAFGATDGSFLQSVANTLAAAIERAEVEAEAREQRRILESVLDTAADGIVVANGEGAFLHCNPAAERVFGPGAGAATADGASERLGVFLPDATTPYPDAERPLARALRGESVDDAEMYVHRADQPDGVWLNVTSRPLVDDLGALRGASAVFRDVTVSRLAAQELRDTNARLAAAVDELRATQQRILQQERLRALGEMASGIAHDFNNALAPVLGFSDLLLMGPETLDDRAKTTRYLTTIRTAADDARNIVARLREFYRQREDGDAFVAIDLEKTVNEAISLTQPKWKDEAQAAGRRIEVCSDIRQTPKIVGNATELREICTNLIFNACDAMAQGGTITIGTRVDTEATCGAEEPTHVILEIGDTGSGMPPEVVQRCLEPFFTTKETHGTGMGLAMVYGSVERHEGMLDIQSREGEGTTFTIRLPIPREAQEAQEGSSVTDVGAALRVLVVDDEPLVREVVAAYLDGDGHAVVQAANGHHALEAFSTQSFDLVITDRAMPEMSGDQLAEAIRARGLDTRIIMLTGFGAVIDSRPAHVDSVVAKPVTLQELRWAVTSVMS